MEIASDPATLGAARVVITNRNQCYVAPKLVSGVLDHLAFTRYIAMAEESLSQAESGVALKQFVPGTAGSPEQFGVPKPRENIFEAGIARSQFFLPLVAEGRITVKPWIASVEHDAVHLPTAAPNPLTVLSLGRATICIFRS